MISFIISTIDNSDDREFVENLYKNYAPWLKARSNRFVKDTHCSEDLLQDCMCSMIKHLDKLKSLPEDKRRAYLAVSIDNLAKNYLKNSSKTVMMKKDDSAGLDFIADDYDFEGELDKKLDYQNLMESIKKLPERDRDIIMMKYDLELSDQEIADVLGIKETSVRMTVHRSLLKLAKLANKQ